MLKVQDEKSTLNNSMHYRLGKLTHEAVVPLPLTALRHLSTELLPPCCASCEHAVMFHKSVTPFRMQWQVSNFSHKPAPPSSFLIFPLLISHLFYSTVLPCLSLFLPQLNDAQNTPLQGNHDKSLSHNLDLSSQFRALLKPKAQKNGLRGYKIRGIWLIFTNNLKANRPRGLALTRYENSAVLLSLSLLSLT